MPKFSRISRIRLETCDPRLQQIMNEAIKQYDFRVICGRRGQAEQDKAFLEGKSKLMFPHSKHNCFPSLAVDIAPYPINWQNTGRFYKLAEVVMEIAANMNIHLTWGGDWTEFQDMPHYEITGERC